MAEGMDEEKVDRFETCWMGRIWVVLDKCTFGKMAAVIWLIFGLPVSSAQVEVD